MTHLGDDPIITLASQWTKVQSTGYQCHMKRWARHGPGPFRGWYAGCTGWNSVSLLHDLRQFKVWGENETGWRFQPLWLKKWSVGIIIPKHQPRTRWHLPRTLFGWWGGDLCWPWSFRGSPCCLEPEICENRPVEFASTWCHLLIWNHLQNLAIFTCFDL